MTALEYLKGFPMFGSPQGYKPGLQRVEAILKALGSPHREVPVIHIAGTNGKGSTAMILSSILQEAGLLTGLYTSPEILSFTDRIRIQGREISLEELEEEVEVIKPAILAISKEESLGEPTFFEVLTALAFHYFYSKSVDIGVLEVGLGGRLDATNLCHSLMSIITNVGLEHTEILGTTLEEITREKAGIIKRGHRVLSASKEEVVIEEMKKRCDALEARLYLLGKDITIESHSSSLSGELFDFHGLGGEYKGLNLSLLGRHQLENAALAIGASLLLKEDFQYNIPKEAIREGLSQVSWPGRLEVFSSSPKILIDGAHNPSGVEALVDFLKDSISYQDLYLLLGVLEDKDKDLIFRQLLPLASHVILTKSESSRASDPYELADFASKYSSLVSVEPDFQQALARALALPKEEDLLIISGSLYTISLARRMLPHLLNKTGHISSSAT